MTIETIDAMCELLKSINKLRRKIIKKLKKIQQMREEINFDLIELQDEETIIYLKMKELKKRIREEKNEY